MDFRVQGLNSDQPASELRRELASNLRNMKFADGLPCQVEPYAPVFGTAQASPRYLLPNQDGTTAWWIYAGNTAIYVTDGTTHYDITPAGGLVDGSTFTQPFSGGVINQLPVLNSKMDGPFWWDQNTLNNLVALPDWPAGDVCEVMRPFREFLIALNIFKGGVRLQDLFRTSDAAAPGDIPRSWTPGSSTQAIERSVSFNPGALVDGWQLVDRFYMYKTDSTYLLQLVGGTFVFNNRPIFSTLGCLAKGCVTEWRGRHFVLSDGDVVMHDGINVESIVKRKVRNDIFDNMDGENYENSYLVMRKDLSELWVCRPRTGTEFPTEAFVIGLDDNFRVGHRELVPTGAPHCTEGLVDVASQDLKPNWDDRMAVNWPDDPTRWNTAAFQRTADQVVIADFTNDKFQQVGAGADFDGTPIATTVERTGLSFDKPTQKKYASALWPRIKANAGTVVLIEVGASDQADGVPTYGPPQPFTVGNGQEYVECDVEGYYLAYRFTTSGQLEWLLPGFKLDTVETGEY